MYIEPNTNIKLLSNVPIESSYNHTLYFATESAQSAYFTSLQKYNLTNYSYQRKGRGIARVGMLADNLFDCNYMMFQNTSFGNKWFYAFITSVEYVSNNVSEITFEIDVIQTWLFDFTLGQCFVEREHSSTDNIGDNILPEPVEIGEYMFSGYEKLTDTLDTLAIVVGVADVTGGTVSGSVYDNVYSGVKYRAFNTGDISSVNNYLTSFVESPDSVVVMYMCPAMAIVPGGNLDYGGVDVPTRGSALSTDIQVDGVTAGVDDFDGYVPKNNKLYTYPYNFLHVDTAGANALSLRYEFFTYPNLIFLEVCPNVSPPVKVVLKPRQYKGISATEQTPLHSESITLDNYPQCSWNMDAYKVWLSQNMTPLGVKTAQSVLTSAVKGGAGGAVGGPAGAIVGAAAGGVSSLLSSAVNIFVDNYTASIAADLCKGNINSGNNAIANDCQNFYKARCHITNNYARAVDDFFSVFGYATKRVKTPNTHARPHWTYVKTVGCVVTGSVPADDERKICNIHDSGITYWMNGSEVGNYTLDNSPA